MMENLKILIFIPCHNEAGSIGELLQEFQQSPKLGDILVIDDGSTDDTYRIAEEHAKVVRFEHNRGLAAAIRYAVDYAVENDYDYCIQIDGDGQHIPAEITTLIRSLESHPADVTIGSRYKENLCLNIGELRRLAGLIISSALWLLYHRKWVADPLSGMRMFNKNAMAHYKSIAHYQYLDAAIIPEMLSAGKSVNEVQVSMRDRVTGESYISGIKGVIFLISLLYTTFTIKIRKRVNT